MIEIRPLRMDERTLAKSMVPEGSAEPDWNNCWAILDGKEMLGFFGMETRLIVEPLYMKGSNHHLQAYGAMTWVDGFLRSIAAQQGKMGYEFFVGNENEKFQELLDRHMPVSGREKPGKFYFRKFEV